MAIRLQDPLNTECVTNHLLNAMPKEIRVLVGGRKPGTAVKAGLLADNYIQVRQTVLDTSNKV